MAIKRLFESPAFYSLAKFSASVSNGIEVHRFRIGRILATYFGVDGRIDFMEGHYFSSVQTF